MGGRRVTGIGGLFFRARDPKALAEWYRTHLGIDTFAEETDLPWWQEAGPTVVAPFPADTDYFGRPDQAWMVNFRVSDLDAILGDLRSAGVVVADDVQVRMASAGSAGRPTRREIASSCGSPLPKPWKGLDEAASP